MRPRVKPGSECRCAGNGRRCAPAIGWPGVGGEPILQIAYIGIGMRKENLSCMSWLSKGQAGITVYTIESRDRLVGQFSELGGPGILSEEVLTRTEQK